MEGKLRFKIDWASLIVGMKFTIFVLFYFVVEGNFQVQAARGAYIWRGDLTEGFLLYEFGGLIFTYILNCYLPKGAFQNLEGLIHGGAYFRNFIVV